MFGTDFPMVWVDYGDRNYIMTRLVWFSGFTLDAPVISHRTIELYLKAYLVSKGEPIKSGTAIWGHDLRTLCDECIKHDEGFAMVEFRRRAEYFQRYFDMVRYPSKLSLPNGHGIWFSFDSCILPLDDVVAFVRPRIELNKDEWAQSTLAHIASASDKHTELQRKALIESNKQIGSIICQQTCRTEVSFDSNFTYDLPGC
jgi:hypothetical protein